MNFGNWLLKSLQGGFNLVGDLVSRLTMLLAKPLSYVYYFFEGIFYAIYQLFNVVIKVLMIFVALLQFFGSLVVGFLRTIFKMLTINYDQTPTYFPDHTYDGLKVVMDLVRPTGLLTVVPLIILALVWLYFVKKMLGLLGGSGGVAADD